MINHNSIPIQAMASGSIDFEGLNPSSSSNNPGYERKTKRKKNDVKNICSPLESNHEMVGKSTSMGQLSKRKRSGRLVRLVSFDVKNDDRNATVKTNPCAPRRICVPMLPRNQYTTTLRRRAITKPPINITTNTDTYGDVSLGMKLIVAGGRVIVQSLNALSDGLASPAQLAGVIHRGDVLLAIGNLSLANLPINQLMEGLRPLSTPDSGGLYERYLDLRFEAAAGLSLLMNHEEEHARSQDNSSMNSTFSLFPMTDNVSGTPLLEPQSKIDLIRPKKIIIEENSNENEREVVEDDKDNFPSDGEAANEIIHELYFNFDSLISAVLAKERYSDRERYESEYFDWKEGISDLLRAATGLGICKKRDDKQLLTRVQRLEMGYRILHITKSLELNLEESDKGRDVKFPKNLNSGISIRSGSSAASKRHYNSDGTITLSNHGNAFDVTNGDESIDSCNSFDEVDSDKLLLGLAARDSVWRTSVMSLLKKSVEFIEIHGKKKRKDSLPPAGAIDSTQNLGVFHFPENASGTPHHGSKPFTLPPREITHVLFELTSYISNSSHDDISVYGANSRISSNISSRRSGTTKDGMMGRTVRGDIALAKHFIVDEALPQWLKTFQPLRVDQRMILWPRQNGRIDSVSGTHDGQFEYRGKPSGVDSLTLDQKKESTRDAGDGRMFHRDNELESETCFLVTYFCTEKVIGDHQDGAQNTIDAGSFIDTYGAYLQIQTCLVFASFVKAGSVISDILRIARDDPNHRDAIKDIQKSDGVFYDSRKLSALLQCLEDIRFETNEGRRKVVIDLCVSGYPDIQPWQVRTACLSLPESESKTRDNCSTNILEDLYYTYLCCLLDPEKGDESAREDLGLVKEFCEWSIGLDPRRRTNPRSMENFMKIALKTSNHQNRYRRDLMMLLNLSTVINNHDLTLNLVDEIVGNDEFSSNGESIRCVFYCLRKIRGTALHLCSNESDETVGFEILRRISALFEKMSTSNFHLWQDSIDLPSEIFNLFEQWKIQGGSSGDDAKMYHLIDFIITVSSVPPDVIDALFLWSSNNFGNSLLSRLENLLCRGIYFSLLKGDYSGTLLRLKEARKSFNELDSNQNNEEKQTKNAVSIWMSLGNGLMSIEK